MDVQSLNPDSLRHEELTALLESANIVETSDAIGEFLSTILICVGLGKAGYSIISEKGEGDPPKKIFPFPKNMVRHSEYVHTYVICVCTYICICRLEWEPRSTKCLVASAICACIPFFMSLQRWSYDSIANHNPMQYICTSCVVILLYKSCLLLAHLSSVTLTCRRSVFAAHLVVVTWRVRGSLF